MNKGIVILLAAGVGTALWLANKGRAAAKLDFYFNTLDFSDFKLSQMKVNTIMTIVNPSNTEQKVDGIFANVYLPDGSQLGRIEQTQVQTIAARGSSNISAPVILFPAGVGKLTAILIQQQQVPTLKIKGYVISLGISLPFEQTI